MHGTEVDVTTTSMNGLSSSDFSPHNTTTNEHRTEQQLVATDQSPNFSLQYTR
jgi:hypothetical protein